MFAVRAKAGVAVWAGKYGEVGVVSGPAPGLADQAGKDNEADKAGKDSEAHKVGNTSNWSSWHVW